MRLSLGGLDLSNGKRYPLDGSEIPFPDLDSILAQLPQYAQGDDVGTMRDAVLNMVREVANKVWADTGAELNGFVSPRFSSRTMLVGVWGVNRKMPPSVGESTGNYRTRLLAAGDGPTPNAIRGAVRAAADEFFAKVAFQEPATDCIFAAGDDVNAQDWWGYAQPDDGIIWSTDPESPNPTTGAFVADDLTGAMFIVIMQLGAGDDVLTPFALADDDVTTTSASCFAADDGVSDYGFCGFDGDPLETRIVAEVQARKAFGVRWMLLESHFLNVQAG